jgi:pseudouridine-5'-phosphate glycosidase
MEKFQENFQPIHTNVLESEAVGQARSLGLPIVALESTVITHGLPQGENIKLARAMEATVMENGATPATVAVIDGQIRLGLSSEELDALASHAHPRKISTRDFGITLAQGLTGGTTVAATAYVAHKQGLRLFATGGIGGVHRQAPFDVSADLSQLAKTPILVVCAGMKAILDLPATMEYLETAGVPVIGFQSDELPAFYSRQSGIPLNQRADTVHEAARIAYAHWSLGFRQGVILAVPVPEADAIPRYEMEAWIEAALAEAKQEGIHGNAVTPYLLDKVSQLSQGRSMQSNIALLLNNARVASQVAGELNALLRHESGRFYIS